MNKTYYITNEEMKEILTTKEWGVIAGIISNSDNIPRIDVDHVEYGKNQVIIHNRKEGANIVLKPGLKKGGNISIYLDSNTKSILEDSTTNNNMNASEYISKLIRMGKGKKLKEKIEMS